MIESLENKKVKEWMKLHQKKYRDSTGLFLVEGEHLCKEAKKANMIKEIITTDSNFRDQFAINYVSPQIMKKLSLQITPSHIIAICYKIVPKKIGSKVLILDNIQDPGNLGTMIRSAVAFSFDTIILSEDTVDLYNDKVLRATEGMLFQINIIRGNILSLLKQMKEYRVFRTDVKQGIKLNQVNLNDQFLAIIIGNEGNGINENIKSVVSEALYIPMSSACESLNAAISASIIMYEVSK